MTFIYLIFIYCYLRVSGVSQFGIGSRPWGGRDAHWWPLGPCPHSGSQGALPFYLSYHALMLLIQIWEAAPRAPKQTQPSSTCPWDTIVWPSWLYLPVSRHQLPYGLFVVSFHSSCKPFPCSSCSMSILEKALNTAFGLQALNLCVGLSPFILAVPLTPGPQVEKTAHCTQQNSKVLYSLKRKGPVLFQFHYGLQSMSLSVHL